MTTNGPFDHEHDDEFGRENEKSAEFASELGGDGQDEGAEAREPGGDPVEPDALAEDSTGNDGDPVEPDARAEDSTGNDADPDAPGREAADPPGVDGDPAEPYAPADGPSGDPAAPGREAEDAAGLTEEFETEFGDEFGADVADELEPDPEPEAEEDEPGREQPPEPQGGREQPPESQDGPEQDVPDVTAQETVEADVLALGDQEEARERAQREAAAEAEAVEAGGETEEEAEEEAEGEEPQEGEAPEPTGVAVAAAPAEEPPKAALWPRFLAASLVIVISVATATSVSLLLYLSDIAKGLGGLPGVQDQLEAVEGGDPQNILVLGSDKRPDLKGDPGRSDTTMLLRLDPDNNAIALLSLPRDLKVNIPGYGVGKLNDAYTVGGPKKTLQVVTGLTGVKIHHVVNVDFAGFEKAINAIDCVYVDVDRRYFNSNEALATDELYAEIDIKAGYQMLCGERALQYVRYRHTDNDIVRAARQQDFLREARQKIGPTRLFRDREELIDIFKKYTTSDIDNEFTMLDVLKTFLGAADAPVQQIHFKGNLGDSYVTASNEQIQKAVEQFLGIQDTPGPLGGEGGGKPKQHKKKKKPDSDGPALTDVAGFAAPYAEQYAPEVGFPVFFPTKLVPGSDVTDESREYKLADEGGKVHRAYKLVFSIPGAAVPFEYYGLMGTTWTDPPILDNPSETREIGGREYDLFFDGDRLRMIAWRTNNAAYWLNNTLLQTLEEDEMIAIADSMDEVAPPKKKKK
ncbi:MAG TPA: LCP family protein [Solirubrobacterales bacterium]|nr:LCP family protein [Solirubrobacterales bacterium]